MIDNDFMQEALVEAEKALELGFFPVGAVMVHEGKVIARAHKTMASTQLDHAEINLLKQVMQGDKWPCAELTLYSTLEPCLMCYGTLRHCQIGRVVYAMEDPYGGATQIDDAALPVRHHTRPVKLQTGVLRENSRQFLRRFLQTTQEPFWAKGGAPQFQELILQE